jgi:outer membrane protein TolC
MSRFFILATGLFFGIRVVSAQTPAQPVPAAKNKAANPAGTPILNSEGSDYSDTVNENRLVALALRGPELDASAHQERINELQLKAAKTTWLNLLAISSQFNDQDFGKPPTINGQAAYVYPKYFFGVTIPLGIIFSQGNQVKEARESIANTKDQQVILTRSIRANVLSKYKQYKEYAVLIQMQNELINDVLAVTSQAEESFKQGKISVDVYIAAQRTKNDEIAKSMNLQLQQDLIRIELERMIGVPLESVLHSPQPTKAALYHK